jgi:hypothetical protein
MVEGMPPFQLEHLISPTCLACRGPVFISYGKTCRQKPQPKRVQQYMPFNLLIFRFAVSLAALLSTIDFQVPVVSSFTHGRNSEESQIAFLHRGFSLLKEGNRLRSIFLLPSVLHNIRLAGFLIGVCSASASGGTKQNIMVTILVHSNFLRPVQAGFCAGVSYSSPSGW